MREDGIVRIITLFLWLNDRVRAVNWPGECSCVEERSPVMELEEEPCFAGENRKILGSKSLCSCCIGTIIALIVIN